MSSEELQCLSRQELCSLVDELRRENDCLKSDLIRYQKIFNKFNEKTFDFRNYLEIKDQINSLNKTNISELESQSNENMNELIEDLNDIKDVENSCDLIDEEVTDNESQGFDRDLLFMNESKDEIRAENEEQKYDINEENIEFNESEEEVKEPKTETIVEMISKRKVNYIRSDSTESDTEFSDNYNEMSGEEWSNASEGSQMSRQGMRRESNLEKGLRKESKKSDKQNDLQVFEVEIDSKQTPNESDINVNIEIKSENTKQYLCPNDNCGRSFDTLRSVRRHESWMHKKVRPINEGPLVDNQYVCLWPGCTKVFNRSSNLYHHEAIHTATDPYLCHVCSATFTTQTYLNRHMKRHEAKYVCDWEGCGYKARDNHNLVKHKIKHSELKRYKCDVRHCGQSFKYESVLREHKFRDHLELYEDLEWLECPHNGCKVRTKSKNMFKAHVKTHDKRHVCPECEKAFNSNYQLKNHILVHSGNTESIRKRIQCEWHGCEQWFPKAYELKEHMNIHTGEMPYHCVWPSCDKKYALKKSLSQHMIRHKQLDYKCKWKGCGYQTTNSNRFKEHKKTHKAIQTEITVRTRNNVIKGKKVKNS